MRLQIQSGITTTILFFGDTLKSNLLIVGIDPGTKGGVALLDGETRKLLYARRAPTFELTILKKGGKEGTRTQYNFAIAWQMLLDIDVRAKAEGRQVALWIEDVPATLNGIRNTLVAMSLGICVGMWKMAATALGWRVEMVTPDIWKEDTWPSHGRKKDKQLSTMTATTRWPEAAKIFEDDGADAGLAEAALIADYGRRKGL